MDDMICWRKWCDSYDPGHFLKGIMEFKASLAAKIWKAFDLQRFRFACIIGMFCSQVSRQHVARGSRRA